jgi:two-component system, chemotaxis family, protein-glutamate methylesterase/glutaminase
MLCDDSAVIRRLVKGALTADPQLEVVYEATNGQDAVDNVGSTRPDVVILDVAMPIMDGIDAARILRRRSRTLPIIMFSSLTGPGAQATMDALAAGASDFAIKPSNSNSFQAATELVQKELIGKIRTLVGIPEETEEETVTPVSTSVGQRDETSSGLRPVTFPSPRQASQPSGNDKISAIAIGVSTGGPQALSKLIAMLPKQFPVPILIAQHMPPVFTGLLAEQLSQQTGHQVKEAKHRDLVSAGEILLAPGNFHLTVGRETNHVVALLDQSPPENSCRPSVDPLFRSVSKTYGREALAVVLTGMGTDGCEGSRSIRQAGGRVFVQDKESSVVWGMPGAVVEIGQADRILPLEQIATELIRAVESKRQPVCV